MIRKCLKCGNDFNAHSTQFYCGSYTGKTGCSYIHDLEKARIKSKKRYIEKKEYIKKQHKEYGQSHKEQIRLQNISTRKHTAEYLKNKYRTDTNFKIAHIIRGRVRDVLKGRTKGDTVANMLGCSIEEFKNYLGSLFLEGMSWDNHGKYGWHIDHIKPCAKFNLSDTEEQRKCFHYSNMQPLWAIDNLQKGTTYYARRP